jgi:phage terminase large subunit
VSTSTVVRYEPRGAARTLFSTRAAEVLLDGPAGTGKSLACLWRVHLAALKHPGIRCLIVRKTAVSLGSTTLVTFEQQVIQTALAERVVRWFGGSPREAPCYRYANGSRIVVGGMDKPEKIMSSEYDLVFADEATELTLTDWEAIQTRLRHGKLPWQQAIAACNPGHPSHWMNQRCDQGLVTRLFSRHRDNPRYYTAAGELTDAGHDYIDGKLGSLTGVRRLRLLDGKWAAAEGLIYEEWDPAVHLLDRFPIPDHWVRWWSVDFGFTHPFVLGWWAESPDGHLILYREIYMTGRLVEEHAEQALQLVTEPVPGVEQRDEPMRLTVSAGRRRWTEPRPRAVICDHDAEGRATLEKHLGMSTVKADKRVSIGIQAVQARLKVQRDGLPRLGIMQDCVVERDQTLVDAKKPTCTAEELPGYIWAIKPGGELKEEPRKEEDDGCDQMRYMVAARDLRDRARMRWLTS